MTKYLFHYLNEVRRQLERRDRLAVFFDFDGTLASITATPQMARLVPATRTAIQSLIHGQRYSVTIVSGRELQDLKRAVSLSGITYAGNHGLEIEGSGLEFLQSEASAGAGLIAELCRDLRLRLRFVAGAIVEFKTLTASVHYRLAAHREIDRIRSEVDAAVAPFRDRLYVAEGKRVLELRPIVPWDKGSAVSWILGQIGLDPPASIYVGDDRTDEDAFAALQGGITIHVGAKSDITSARYFVRAPSEVRAFIEYLLLIRGLAQTEVDSLKQIDTFPAFPDALGLRKNGEVN